MSREQVLQIIKENRQEVINSFGVKQLYLFGSVARDEAQNTSEINKDMLLVAQTLHRASFRHIDRN
jgi:predicted nucleotidyltransferase